MAVLELTSAQDALAKAKALEIQVQAATFTKLDSDLDADMAKLRAWAKAEELRLASVDALVLNHKRKRYVAGLKKVQEYAAQNLRLKHCKTADLDVELATWRSGLFATTEVKACNRRGCWVHKTSNCLTASLARKISASACSQSKSTPQLYFLHSQS